MEERLIRGKVEMSIANKIKKKCALQKLMKSKMPS